ncbi:SGNH/GDSL hydrolase family protein [Spongiibacter tropicus]|uniref:SGNH/GDSL hydrolase family protein n=1 Tax=Spongiibacter tropicus TaxID=454602 RepID=UPI0003B353D5|nr:hypothetical protein [Spongiibacter tropicus]
MADEYTNAQKLAAVTAAFEEMFKGDDATDVTYDGETKPSVEKRFKHIIDDYGNIVDLTAAAEAAATGSQAAALQAAGAGHVYADTTSAQSNGVLSALINSGGTGGTDGQYDVSVTGDGGGALYRAVVSGGAIVLMQKVSAGANYTAAAFDFSGIAGLSGHDVDAVLGQNRAPGELYLVPISGGNGAARYYKNNAGTPYTEDDWVLASSAVVQSLFAEYSVESSYIPLFKTADDRVPLWLENFKLAAKGLSDGLLSSIEAYLAELGATITEGEPGYPDFTILTADDKVIFRYQDGVAYYYGKAPNVGAVDSRPRGASLFAYKTAIAKAIEGAGNAIKVALTGDSWRERWLIPQRIADKGYAAYGRGADGWLSVSSTDDAEGIGSRKPLNDAILVRSGWTLTDISEAAKTGLLAPDGHRIACSNTAGTLTYYGIRAVTLNIYYLDNEGDFRYRVDGGAWATVNAGVSGTTAKIEITGLSALGTHTLEIDTSVNTGTVTLFGFYATGIAGFEASKIANSGATAPQYASIAADESVQYILQDIGFDLVEACLGTNDFNQGVSLASYRSGLEALGGAYQGARAETGIVITSPPVCNTTGTYPMSSYRDKAAEAVKALDCEHFDLYSRFADFEAMDGLGVWGDDFHLNYIGGRLNAEELAAEFLLPFEV